MKELGTEQLERRLSALYDDLAEYPPGIPCAWPLSRVFNELLKQVKRELEDDPIVNAIAVVREHAVEAEHVNAGTHVGTVRTLTGQLLAAIQSPALAPEPAAKPAHRTSAPSAR